MPCGIEGRRHKIGAAPLIRQAFLASADLFEDDRPSVWADLARPIGSREGFADEQLAVLAIKYVEETVAVGEHHHLVRLPCDGEVAEHRDLRRIPVVNVVRGELVMPLEHAGVGIERQERAGVQIVALSIVAIVIRIRVAGAVVDEVQRRVQALPRRARALARGPDGASTPEHRFDAGPSLAPPLARPGNGVEPPSAGPGLGVVGIDETAAGEIAARHTDDHLVLDDERGQRDGVAVFGFLDRGVPDHVAGLAIERDQVSVKRAHIQLVAQDGGAAVHHPAADAQQIRQRSLVVPDGSSRTGVQRPGMIEVAGEVHDTIEDDRRALQPATRRRRRSLEQPLRRQLIDILRGKLRQRAIPPRSVVPSEHEPLRRILQAVQQHLRRDGRRRDRLRRALLRKQRQASEGGGERG